MYVRTLNYGLDSNQELNVDRSTFTFLAFELEQKNFSVFWTHNRILFIGWGSFRYVVGFSIIYLKKNKDHKLVIFFSS